MTVVLRSSTEPRWPKRQRAETTSLRIERHLAPDDSRGMDCRRGLQRNDCWRDKELRESRSIMRCTAADRGVQCNRPVTRKLQLIRGIWEREATE